MKTRRVVALPQTFLLLASKQQFQPCGRAAVARLRVWAGFALLKVQEKVCFWSRRDLDTCCCKGNFENQKRSFSLVTGQLLQQGPIGRGRAEQGWGLWDAQPAWWGGKNAFRDFSGPSTVCSGIFTY